MICIVSTIVEFTGSRCCRYVRTSVVYGGKQSAICGRRLHMPILLGGHAHVALLLRSDLGLSWPRRCSAVAAVEADAGVRGVLINHRCVVDVANYRRVHIGDRAVIEIFAALPVATEEAHAGIPETKVNPAVKTNGLSPISSVPNVEVVIEPPSSRHRCTPNSQAPRCSQLPDRSAAHTLAESAGQRGRKQLCPRPR